MGSTPTKVPDKCCDRCSPRRTCQQFFRNHVKQDVPVSEGDDCRICWNDYGVMSVAQGIPDVACQIVGISGCNHTFGLACIKHITYNGTTFCPLCSTQWFVNSFTDEHGNGDESDDEAQRDEYPHMIAGRYSIDYDTARFRTYSEPEYYPLMSSMRLHEHEKVFEHAQQIRNEIMTEEIQDLAERLQDSSPNILDLRLYDPHRISQLMYPYENP